MEILYMDIHIQKEKAYDDDDEEEGSRKSLPETREKLEKGKSRRGRKKRKKRLSFLLVWRKG